MEQSETLGKIVELTKHLSLLEKVRLIEEIAPQIERELRASRSTKRIPLRGLWKGINISDEEIAAARAEMWGGFPRKDI